MCGSEAPADYDGGKDSMSKEANDESPDGMAGTAQDVRQRTTIRKIMGPKLPCLQPAIHSGATDPGLH